MRLRYIVLITLWCFTLVQAQTITKVDVMEHWLEEGTSVVDINNDKIINNLDWALAHEEVNMANIYVSPTGNDSTGDGSQENPYLTFSKASTVSSNGDTVLMEQGTYTTPITNITKSLSIVGLGTGAIWDLNPVGYVYFTKNLSFKNLNFVNAPSAAVICSSDNDTNVVTFDNCHFYNNSNNGLETFGNNPSNNITVIANNCSSYNNGGDGFSLRGTNTNNKIIRLELIDCEAYWNDNIDNVGTGTGGASGDGATSHAVGHELYIRGGYYYQNGKCGIAVVGGSLVLEDAEIYNNGVVAKTFDVIFHSSEATPFTTSARISNCSFHSLLDTTGSYWHINVGEATSGVDIVDCNFSDPTNAFQAGLYAIKIKANASANIQGNIFSGFTTGGGNAAIDKEATSGAVKITNNTFFNCGYGIRVRGGYITSYNNIFSNNLYGLYEDSGNYIERQSLGYNNFHNCSYKTKNDLVRYTDIEVDPQFRDPDNGDFMPTNPLIYSAGINGGAIGAVNNTPEATYFKLSDAVHVPPKGIFNF